MSDDDKKASKLDAKKLLTRIRTRFRLMEEADHENRRCAMDDMKFVNVPGWQWDETVKKARGDRPCYEFNKLRIKIKRIINEMRANRPEGKVIAVEDGDRDTAQVIEGLGRNILSVCDFDTTSDYAGEYQVGGGMGAWRIVTEYADDGFDQDVIVKPIPNPFNLYWDPASVDVLHRDAHDWCLIDRISKTAYKERWPDAEVVNFDAGEEFDDDHDWTDENTVRICEYHWKEKYDKRRLQLNDGRVIDADSDAGRMILADPDAKQTIRRERVAKCDRIMMCVASGDAILEKPTELKGKYHRFVVAHGEWVIIDGKPQWCGLTRFAKDAQRAYNIASTSVTETIATAPNSHYWVTPEQAKGNTAQWNKAISENLPWLVFNPDPKHPGAPQRVGGADVPVALLQEAQIRDQELKDVTGVYDAALGERSNEKSGVAIARREQQTQLVNFNFPDNMAKAKQLTVQIINDLIPHYYDTARTIRVIGKDGAEDFVKINSVGVDPQTGEPVLLNDLTRGKYDVTVTVGPSFATQREAAAQTYSQMAAQDPSLMAVAGDLVYQSMDLPYADQIAERRRAMLPPQVQAVMNQDKEAPPEVRQALAQIDGMKQQLDQQGQMIQAAATEAEQVKSEAGKAVSDLKVQRAQFDADVAKQLASIAEREANLTLAEAKLVQDATQQTIAQQEAKPPSRKAVRIRRVNGELIGEIAEVTS